MCSPGSGLPPAPPSLPRPPQFRYGVARAVEVEEPGHHAGANVEATPPSAPEQAVGRPHRGEAGEPLCLPVPCTGRRPASALAVPLPVPLDLGAALAAGGSLEVFAVCWATTLQQEIPPDKLSRIASYDALGGIALTPVATAVAGPAATALGTTAVLTVAGALVATLPLLVLLTPEGRRIR